jgi:hypothetical protein
MTALLDVGISNNGNDLRSGPGIYFLVSGSDVVYVGQAVSVISRVAQHCKDKDFTGSRFMPMRKGDLSFVESYLISILLPQMNKQIPLIGQRSQYEKGRVSKSAMKFLVQFLSSLPSDMVSMRFAEAMQKLASTYRYSKGFRRPRYRTQIRRSLEVMRRVVGDKAYAQIPNEFRSIVH